MEKLELKPREIGLGSKPHQLRKRGVLPVAVVSTGEETILAQTDSRVFEEVMKHNEGLAKFMAKLDGEGKAFEVIVKEVQKTAIDRKIIHAVLQRVKETDTVKVSVPIIVHGDPVGVVKGRSTIAQYTDSIEVKGRLSLIPESIEIDASGLNDDDKILVGSIQLPHGVECLTSADATVVSCHTMRAHADEGLEETVEEAEVVETEAPTEE